MRSNLTRREVVVAGGLGVAGGVAGALSAQAAAAPAEAGNGPSRGRDLRLLGALLRTEQVLEYAYRRVLRSFSLGSSARGVLELILGHEVEHTAVLEHHMATLASELGPAAQAAARQGSSARSEVAGMLSAAQTPRDALRVLSKVESLSEASYFNTIGELQSPDLALTAAQILASEAQHWSLLLNVLTEGKVPEIAPLSFVRGVAQISS